MLWIIVALLSVFLAFGARGVRKALAIALGIALLLFSALAIYIGVDESKAKSEREASRKRVPFSQVKLQT